MTDKSTEMVPPWEAFPTYERMTIGWRMGAGEDYRYKWYEFTDQLPNDYDSRFEYLRRHRPAPLTWGDEVLGVLYPEAESDQEYGCSPGEIEKLLSLGLVELLREMLQQPRIPSEWTEWVDEHTSYW